MRIAQVLPTTLIDYPDRVAALVFVPGCSFRCPFCHNSELVLPQKIAALTLIPENDLHYFLRERASFLDAVVITGGEPTLDDDLPRFIKRVKRLGLLVKLDTNGSRPDVVERLLDEDLLDYVAMDVKAPPDRYDALCGTRVDLAAIRRSIALLIEQAPDYEFRTTVAPTLTEADVRAIADLIAGARRYILQRFVVPEGKGLVDAAWQERPALPQDVLETLWSEIKDRFADGGVR
jgi:pyruvate formate lyase activating enzyme